MSTPKRPSLTQFSTARELVNALGDKTVHHDSDDDLCTECLLFDKEELIHCIEKFVDSKLHPSHVSFDGIPDIDLSDVSKDVFLLKEIGILTQDGHLSDSYNGGLKKDDGFVSRSSDGVYGFDEEDIKVTHKENPVNANPSNPLTVDDTVYILNEEDVVIENPDDFDLCEDLSETIDRLWPTDKGK